ncbi:MAG: hypothetical protein QXE38_03285 [Candidatus Methanomethylicia archaeon]
MYRNEIVNLLIASYEISHEDSEAADIGNIDFKNVRDFIEKVRLTAIPHDELKILSESWTNR